MNDDTEKCFNAFIKKPRCHEYDKNKAEKFNMLAKNE